MKRTIISAILVIALLVVGGYLLYRTLMPQFIAEAMISNSPPGYIPKRLQNRVESLKIPLNKGTEAMLEKMHAADIPLSQLLHAVDNISEGQAYAFLDDLNETKPLNTNEIFDIAKKHFSRDFDLEVFRDPFTRYFQMKQVKYAIAFANLNRKSNDVDISTAKEILKEILIEKDKEMRKKH